jgi:tetratricopeptide (TPR) repeat protein
LRKGRARLYVDYRQAEQELRDALRQPGLGPGLLSTIHRECSWAAWQHNLQAAERHAEEAVRLAEQGGDRGLVAAALNVLIVATTMIGSVVPEGLMARALELDSVAATYMVFDRPKAILAIRLALAGELDDGRTILLQLLDEATIRGDEASASDILGRLGWVEDLMGNWRASLSYHARASAALPDPDPDLWLARVHARVGDIGRAAAEAQMGLDYSAQAHHTESGIEARAVLGFIDLSNGDAEHAHEHLAAAWDAHQEWGFGEPGPWFLFVADHVEALIELGRHEDAIGVLGWLEERGGALGRP